VPIEEFTFPTAGLDGTAMADGHPDGLRGVINPMDDFLLDDVVSAMAIEEHESPESVFDE